MQNNAVKCLQGLGQDIVTLLYVHWQPHNFCAGITLSLLRMNYLVKKIKYLIILTTVIPTVYILSTYILDNASYL